MCLKILFKFSLMNKIFIIVIRLYMSMELKNFWMHNTGPRVSASKACYHRKRYWWRH